MSTVPDDFQIETRPLGGDGVVVAVGGDIDLFTMREFKDAVTGRGDEQPPSLPRAPEDEENVAAAPPRERDTVS